jgi:NAD/NADP transhydrogenase beta subunit
MALSIPFSINSLGLNLSSTFQILFGVLGTAIVELLLFSASFYFMKNSFNISMNTYHKENNDINHKIRKLFNVDMKLYYMCSALTFFLSLIALFYLYTSADIVKQQFLFENIKHKYTVFQCLIVVVSYYFFNEMNNKLQKKRLELMLTKSR